MQHTVAFCKQIAGTFPTLNAYHYVDRFVLSPLGRATQFVRSIWNDTAYSEEPRKTRIVDLPIEPVAGKTEKDISLPTLGEVDRMQWGQFDNSAQDIQDVIHGRKLGLWPGTYSQSLNESTKPCAWSSSLQPLMTTGTDQLVPLESRGQIACHYKPFDPITRPVFRQTDECNADFFRNQHIPDIEDLEKILLAAAEGKPANLFKQKDPEGEDVNKTHYSCIKPFPIADTKIEEKTPAAEMLPASVAVEA